MISIHKSDDHLMTINLIKEMTKMGQQSCFLEAIRNQLKEIYKNEPESFKSAHHDDEIMKQILNIFSIEIDDPEDFPKAENIEFITNDKFYYAFIKRNSGYNILLLKELAILSRGASFTTFCPINPNIIPEYFPLNGLTPHQKMDAEIQLNEFLNHPEYASLNKIIYAALIIKKAPYHLRYRDLFVKAGFLLKMAYNKALFGDYPEQNKLLYEVNNFKLFLRKFLKQNNPKDLNKSCEKAYKILDESL